MISFRLWLSHLLRLLSDLPRFVPLYPLQPRHELFLQPSHFCFDYSVCFVESSEMNNELRFLHIRLIYRIQGSPSVAASRQLAELAIDRRGTPKRKPWGSVEQHTDGSYRLNLFILCDT